MGLIVIPSAALPERHGQALRHCGRYTTMTSRFLISQSLRTRASPPYGNYIMPWYDRYDVGLKEKWFSPGYDASRWKSVHLPGGFAGLGVPDTPAVGRFRKEITLPDPPRKGLTLISLGEVQRMDSVYVNGTFVGASAWVEHPRIYRIPADVLKQGRNLIAIRIFKTEPRGGFLGQPSDLRLTLREHTVIPLAGAWRGKISVDARPPHPMPLHFANWPVMPTVLYNGMLVPIAPLTITGAIWYQGEQNSPRGYEYRRLLPAVIASWRRLFGQGDFPFYLVQLPALARAAPRPQMMDGRTSGVAGDRGGDRSPFLSRSDHRCRRRRQPSSRKQAAGGRASGALRAEPVLR